ncbi:MAG: DEAD/DEAH box helicase [Sphaerochaeta sp.]|nr:DEAD/DEAH box helicase [Sphaerochaeta sp.]
MFDAYKTEQEIKQNVVDFLLDWKNVRDLDVRKKLTSLWTSDTPAEGSLLSELLVENNFSYVFGEKNATTENLAPPAFQGFIEHLSFRENILANWKLPKLPNGNKCFGGRTGLQEDFLNVMSDNHFKATTPLFKHQVQAIRTALAGKDFILSSGTGSGKTEAFLLPTLAKLFNESDEERKQSGVRVLIIYPMNALINSQVTRLQSLIGAQDPNRVPIRFALYNSKLKESQSRANAYMNDTPDYCHWPDVQSMNRDELRTDPPHILVTNYSMLEYALIRPKDLPLFYPERQKLHTIILDEAHTYIGAMAAEIAMLIRRILIAFDKTSSEVQFFATSATLGDPEKDKGYILRKFASDIFSKDITMIEYIDGQRILPLKGIKHKKPVPTEALLEMFGKLQTIEDDAPEETKLAVVVKLFPDVKTSLFSAALYQLFSRNEVVVSLVNGLAKEPLTITNVAKKLGLSSTKEDLRYAFLFVKHLSTIESEKSDDPLVKIRLHSVVEAPSGVMVCPRCNTFYGSYQEHCTNAECNEEPLRELVICKQCGASYLCLLKSAEGKVERINWRGKTDMSKLEVTTLAGGNAKTLQCLSCSSKDTSFGDDITDEDLLAQDKEITDPEVVLYKRSYFSPLSVSIEVIQKIVIDTLFSNLDPHPGNGPDRWLPGEGRRLLTFSDSRKGAANLPSALDWLHELYLGNRLIFEACSNAIEGSNATPENFFAGFSEVGKSWRLVYKKESQFIEQLVALLPTITEETLIQAIDNALAIDSHALHFFPGAYEKSHLVQDILNSIIPNSVEKVTFPTVIETLANLPQLKEMVGIFDQIERENSWQESSTRQKIAYWILSRSLGIISSSRYLPENAGLCFLSFPIPPTFISCLQQEEAFKIYSTDEVERIVQAMLCRMRDTGTIFVDYPNASNNGLADPLADAASYCFQSIVINKYMVLEHTMVPKDSSFITNWYNLNIDRDTAGIQIIKKSLGDDSISLNKTRNMLATAWSHMIGELGFLQEHPQYKGAYALDIRKASLSLAPSVYRCQECGRFSPHHINGMCLTPSCKGSVALMAEEEVQSLYGHNRSKNFPQLGMRTVEHTAQLDLSQLTTNEKKFTNGEINLLSSSTTMELGIDIGGLTSILLTNCPPGPSNYLQRAGRAGRRSDRVAYVLTCARKVPLDHYFFLHPDLFFTRKPHDPYVSLNSEKVVKRHLNSYVLREFFTHLEKNIPELQGTFGGNPLASYGTVMTFFGYEQTKLLTRPVIDHLLEWLDSDPPLLQLARLLENTNLLFTYNKASLLLDLKKFFAEKKEMVNTYIHELDREIFTTQNTRRKTVLAYYRKDFLEKDLVRFLIDSSLLPKYGFPVDVVALNTQNDKSRLPDPNAVTTNTRKNQFRLERGSDVAISEYAPGASVVAGKRLLISRGISLDSRFGGESFSTDNNLERLGYVICKKCGHFYILPPSSREMPCPVCSTTIRYYASIDEEDITKNVDNIPRYAILPKGFRVDYSEKQPFAPNKIEWSRASSRIFPELQTNLSSFNQVIPDLMSIASSPSATFYAVNQGPGDCGYAICYSCGRAEAQIEFEAGRNPLLNHTRLYSDQICKGNVSHYQNLVARFVTDAIQIRFKGEAVPVLDSIEDAQVFMKTFGRCLLLAAAKYLGLDDRELKCIVQNYWDPQTSKWNNLEIVLYDNVAGGAGYADMVMGLFGIPDFYDVLYATTECPEQCSEACPACLIAYEKDESGKVCYNRHLVQNFLNRDDIKAFLTKYVGTIVPKQGDAIVYNIVDDITSMLRDKAKGKIEFVFTALPEDQFAVVGSKFGQLLELAKAGIEVTLLFLEEPARQLHRQMIETLRYGFEYAQGKLKLRLMDTQENTHVVACIESESHRFAYTSFALPEQGHIATPFSAFPFARRAYELDESPWIRGSEWKLPPNPSGMFSFKTEEKRIDSIDDVHLWSLLCSRFSLSSIKPITKVWYSDRYLLRFSENICFLMLLEDMPLASLAEINLAVHGDRSSYCDFAFQERDDQRTFLARQLFMSNLQSPNLRMFITTDQAKSNDPGQAHDREMFIEFNDGSKVKLSFDSGMSLFAPFIDRYWKMNEVTHREMMQHCQQQLGKEPNYGSSLIFKYSDNADEKPLDVRFKEALDGGRIKVLL